MTSIILMKAKSQVLSILLLTNLATVTNSIISQVRPPQKMPNRNQLNLKRTSRTKLWSRQHLIAVWRQPTPMSTMSWFPHQQTENYQQKPLPFFHFSLQCRIPILVICLASNPKSQRHLKDQFSCTVAYSTWRLQSRPTTSKLLQLTRVISRY